MGPTMRRLWACAVAALALQGCAAANDPAPSFLGALVSDPDQPQAAANASPPEALDHVQSNKVLGAMAFQKITGRTVDPERLSGGSRP